MGIGSFPASQVRLVLDEQRLDCCATKHLGALNIQVGVVPLMT